VRDSFPGYEPNLGFVMDGLTNGLISQHSCDSTGSTASVEKTVCSKPFGVNHQKKWLTARKSG